MVERYHSIMRSISPAYCPEEGVWFTDDDVTAKSLNELQRKLGSNVIIDCYFPEGFGNVVRPREVYKEDLSAAAPGMVVPSAEMPPIRAPRRRYDTPVQPSFLPDMEWGPEQLAKLVRLAEEGLSAGEIANKIGCSRNAVIGKCRRKKIVLKGKPGFQPGKNPRQSKKD